MTFNAPWAFMLLPLVLIPLWLNRQAGGVYSWMGIVPEDRISQITGIVLRYIVVGIIACLLIALAQPHGPVTEVERIGKGAQVMLVIDRSASMDDPFAGAGVGGQVGENKAAAAKRLISQFVRERKDDMVGVVTFSNSAMHAIPLTQSREAIYAAINAAGGSGLLQTNIGAGLTSGLSTFQKMPDSGSRAIILLSDGAGRISQKAKQKISDWSTGLHVNLYWIVLRQPDGISIFSTNYEEGYMPAEVELHKFFQTLKTKYQAYEAEDPSTLQSAIQDISMRENSPIRYYEKIPGQSYTNVFVALTTLMLMLLLLIKYLEVQAWQRV